MSAQNITKEDVTWIVNNKGELGVKIGNCFFFMYKSEPLEYTEDDGPTMYRRVGKREFGESGPISPDYHGNRGMMGVESPSFVAETEGYAGAQWKPLPKSQKSHQQPIAYDCGANDTALCKFHPGVCDGCRRAEANR